MPTQELFCLLQALGNGSGFRASVGADFAPSTQFNTALDTTGTGVMTGCDVPLIPEVHLSLSCHESVENELQSTLADIRHLDLTQRVSYSGYSGFHAGGGFSDIRVGTCDMAERGNVKVAVKCTRLYLDKRAQIIKLVEKEIRVWSGLRHKNILPLLGYSIDDNGLPSFISDFMENGTAFQYVSAHPEFDVLPMILGIAEGVGYLHERGVIHSDLKADNVLISALREPLICDFGISRMIISQTMAHIPSSTHDVRGTSRWMSPELLLPPPGQSPLHTKESDVWAFGMTVYELLARRTPYHQFPLVATVINAIVSGHLPGRLEKFDALPSHYHLAWDVCKACWSKQSMSRPKMNEIIITLKDSVHSPRTSNDEDENPSTASTPTNPSHPSSGAMALPITVDSSTPREGLSLEAGNNLPPLLQLRPRSVSLVPVILSEYSDIYTGTCDISGRGTVKIAIKRGRFHDFESTLKLIEKEVWVWSSLQHKNVLPLLGYSIEESGLPSLISEFMDNGTAFQYVNTHPEFDVLPMILGIAEGVGYLHERGIIHSNLNIHDVLISQYGEPLICSFSVARIISVCQPMHGQSGNIQSTPVTMGGTPRWMSPELLIASENHTSAIHTMASDVWAFGMIAYSFLARRRPYHEIDTEIQVVLAVCRDQLPEKPEIFKEWPAHYLATWNLCEACWLREPRIRPKMGLVIARMKEMVSSLESSDIGYTK